VPAAPQQWSRGRPPGAPVSTRESRSCALDQVNAGPVPGVLEIRAGDPVEAEGWAADTAGGLPAGSAWMMLRDGDTVLHIPVELGRPRPDVAAATGKHALATAGYRVVASADGIPNGRYGMSIIWVDANGWMSCDLRSTLWLRG
jgi:hypothetical protein